MSRRYELAERILCALISASYGDEGYVPQLLDEDFVELKEGDWLKRDGYFIRRRENSVYPDGTKFYAMMTTLERRMARDAIRQADVMLQVESEASRAGTQALVRKIDSAAAHMKFGIARALCVGDVEPGTLVDEKGEVVYRISTVPVLEDADVPEPVRARLAEQLRVDAAKFAASDKLLAACKAAVAATENDEDPANLPPQVLELLNAAISDATGGAA